MIRNRASTINKPAWLSVLGFLFFSVAVWADGSGVINPFPETGAYSAMHREDRGAVSIIEFAGNYDREIGNAINPEPRAVVAKEFYRTHADNYDFLVVFTSFEFNTGDALAMHWGVQNRVQGIGLEQYDISNLFGSNGRLQGFIDMAALSRYVLDPLHPEFENVLSVLGHEVLHQWSGRVRFDQGLGLNTGLLGKDGSHWSNLLDSDGSVLYGHDWRNNGDGSFTSTAHQKFFSPLDLYLAGLYGAAEVPPMTLINNAAINPELTPSQGLLTHGTTINGSATVINIGDIIAAEGERVPSVADSQKDFRFAFILLTGPDENISERQIGAIDAVRRSFVDRFAIWTGGRATANAYPQVLTDVTGGTPDTVSGSDIRTASADVEEAFAWLRARQTTEGFWRDKDSTTMRDTAVVTDILSRFDAFFARQTDAVSWITSQNQNNGDYLARQAGVLNRLGDEDDAAALRSRLLSAQNTDGGWGINDGYDSNPLDTALALSALTDQTGVVASVTDQAIGYIKAQQNADGGWGNRGGSPSRTSVTTTVMQALRQAGQTNDNANVIAFLAGKQNPDGGFGDSPSTVHDTANTLSLLSDLNALSEVRTDDATAYLLTRQGEDGDWSGSTYATALAAAALQRFDYINWLIRRSSVNPQNPNDGERVKLAFTVTNDSNQSAPATVLRLYDGDPNTGGGVIGSDVNIVALAPQQSATVTIYWDTFGLAGKHQLFAWVDPDNNQVETSETDNRVITEVTVGNAPAGVDFSIAPQDVAVIPAAPVVLPTDLGFAVTVRNLGLSDANNVRVQLRENSADGPVLDEQIIDIPNRLTAATNFTYALTTPGFKRFVIVVDPDDRYQEAREDNNTVIVDIGTQNSLDLEVNSSDISADLTSAVIGDDVTFSVVLRNRGTVNTPAAAVRYLISDGTTTAEIAGNTLQLDAGQSTQQTVVWRVDREGDLTFTVQLDPDNLLAELSETNNTASLNFTAGQATGPNLVVSYKDFNFSPEPGLEGQALTLSALVRNTGNIDAENVEVAFYNGNPNDGGVLIEQIQTVSSLPAGAEETVVLEWSEVPDASDKLLFVVVDPNQQINEFSEQDNSAFNLLDILSLPDLAIAPADINLTPPFPSLGDSVTLNAGVSNLGEQDADNVVVRMFDGDPDDGGQLLGTEQTISVAGNNGSTASVQFILTGNEEIRNLYVQVDPDNTIRESDETNNTAQRTVSVQDGDFAVSYRYFSPNGDGVQDSTQLFFRLEQAADVSVIVINESDEIVRTFKGEEFNAVTEGEVEWDGLDDLGRLVRDGQYRIQVRSADGFINGETSVVVDTNRLPLMQALGTSYAAFTNLTCSLTYYDEFIAAESDSSFLVYIDYDPDYPQGLYKTDAGGGDLQPLLLTAAIGENLDLREISINPDLSSIAMSIRDYESGERQLWVVDGDGDNLRQIWQYPQSLLLLGFGPQDESLIVLSNLNTDQNLYLVRLDGSGETALLDITGNRFMTHAFSPDHNSLLLDVADTNNDARFLYLVDLNTGEITQVAAETNIVNANSADEAFWSFSWSPDGRQFAVVSTYTLDVALYDELGNVLNRYDWGNGLNPADVAVDNLTAPQWSTVSSELAFVTSTESGSGGPILLLSAGLDFDEPTPDGLYLVDLQAGSVERIHEYNVNPGQPSPTPAFSDFLWAPWTRTLLYVSNNFYELDSYPNWSAFAFDLNQGYEPVIVFDDFKDGGYGNVPADFNSRGFGKNLQFANSDRYLLFDSEIVRENPYSTCNGYEDKWLFRNLGNLTADLRAVRSSASGGISLSGSAMDVNFASYSLEYASQSDPEVWRPIQPSSGQTVIDDNFTTWIPPSAGSYLVRLSVTDLAGNTKQTIKRVAWSEAQSITDLQRTPALFSPNGDGVMDVSTIQYRVLSPVHLEFNFYDSRGQLVRTVIRDHAETGSIFSFDWDGRDGNGVVVDDGVYRMTVQNYEFFFEVDSTYPVVAFALSEAYQSKTTLIDGQELDVVDVNPYLSWQVAEIHHKDASIQTTTVDNPTNWMELVDPDPDRVGLNEEVIHPLPLEQTNKALFRYVLEDAAGNRTVSDVGPISEQLIVSRFGSHLLSPNPEDDAELNLENYGGTSTPDVYESLSNIIFAPFDSETGSPEVIVASQGPTRFLVSETIQNNLVDLSIQYRTLQSQEWTNSAFSSLLEAGRVAPDTINNISDVQHHFQVVWDTSNLESSVTFAVRLRGRDSSGTEFYSNMIQVQLRPDALSFKGLARDASFDERINIINPLLDTAVGTGEYVLWGHATGDPERWSNVRVFVQSDDDPRYAVEQEIGATTNIAGGYVVRTSELSSCKSYKGYAVGERPAYTDPVQGFIPAQIRTTPITPFSTPCIALAVKTEPVPVESCNMPSTEQVKVKFATSSLDDSALSLLTLSTSDIADVIFNVNQPGSVRISSNIDQQTFNYEFTVDTSTLDEGTSQYIARLVNVNNEEVIVPVHILVDRTPPNLTISYPANGDLVCGVQRPVVTKSGKTVIYNVMSVDGQLEDDNGLHYTVQNSLGNIFSETAATLVHDSRTLDSFAVANGGYGNISPANPDFHIRGGLTGPLAELFNKNGPMTVRLSVYDEGGFRQCTDRTFIFDGLVQMGDVSVNPKTISPNADSHFDELTLSYSVDENINLDVAIYAAERSEDGSVLPTGSVLRQLESQTQVFTGTSQSIWDGRDDGGQVVNDGEYVIEMTFTDTCGNQTVRRFAVEVDNTPPAITIDFPNTGDPLPQIIEVQGSVSDPNILNWTVEFGAGDTPATYTPLASGTANKNQEVLAQWNTYGLIGPHTLQIRAVDTVGNERIVQIPLNIDVPISLISYFEAVEPLFSPNGDGKLESTGIRFGLEQDALVTLSILNSGGTAVSELLSNVLLESGPVVNPWNGLNNSGVLVADGIYTVYLSAELASNPLIRQEEFITVVVDTTSPEIDITRPANGFIQAVGSVIGSVTDSHLQQYTVFLTDTPNAPSWSELAAGVNSRIDAALASLSNLDEGDYAVRVNAVDEGGIITDVIIPFSVDNTPPVVGLSEPENNAFLSSAEGPIAIRGTVVEDNPARYTLSYGEPGTDPQSYLTLLTSTVFPVPDPVLQWDVSSVADGAYTLRLEAEDKAELSAGSSIELVIDNTAPVAVISYPENNDYVTGPINVIGTVNDINLQEYTVSLAPGAAGESQSFSTVGGGNASVDAAKLISWDALPPDGIHTLRLFVVDQAGNTRSNSVTVNVDTTPPAAPVGLNGDVQTNLSVQLNWETNSESDLAGYNVYRDGELLTQTLISNTQYTDTALSEGTVSYTVRAVDLAGNESVDSESLNIEVDITPPDVKFIKPLDGATVSNIVEVIGTAFSLDDFKEYRLYVANITSPDSRQLIRRSPASIQADILADWDTTLLTNDAQYIISLEAEDLSGNVAEESVTVTIDNIPPAQPTGLTAVANADTVQLNWNANSEADLLGYLLYRDGRLVNASGTVVGSLEPYAITANNFDDTAVPDGLHRYTVIAIDKTGNLSDESLPAEVEIDLRAPSAIIVQPADGSDFEAPIYLLATSPDSDIADIQFEYRPAGAVDWIILGTDNEAPFSFDFDPVAQAVNYGGYEFRSVATDNSNQTDPAPSYITLNYTDLTAPLPVENLTAQVDGRQVTLNWQPSAEIDFLEYRVERINKWGDSSTFVPLTNSFIDNGLFEGEYRYILTVFDTYGNESEPVETSALVYWVEIESIENPTSAASVTVRGKGEIPASVVAEITNDLGATNLPIVETDSSGAFVLTDVPLEIGENVILLRLRDANGNLSIARSISITRAQIPSQPTGLQGTVDNFNANLSWNVNPETDISGYRVIRDGVEQAVVPGTSFSETLSDGTYAYSIAAISTLGYESIPSETVVLEVGDIVAPESVTLTGSVTNSDVALSWTESASTDVIRYDVYRDGNIIAQITDTASLTYNDLSLPNGIYEYTVVAVDGADNQSEPSNTVALTVNINLPDPPTGLNASLVEPNAIQLIWDASQSTTVSAYRIHRATVTGGPYAIIGEVPSTITEYIDANLPSGVTYFYVVTSVDSAGNSSEYSNEASATTAGVIATIRPTLFKPTIAGIPVTLPVSTTSISGSAGPASLIDLYVNGAQLAQTTASAAAEVIPAELADNCYQVRLSPDGRYVTCALESGGGDFLQLYDFETGESKTIINVENAYMETRWFSDSNRLIFTSIDYDTQTGLARIYNLATGSIESITSPVNSSVVNAVPSSDKGRLAIVGSYTDANNQPFEGIFISSTGSGNWRQIYSIDAASIDPWSVHWSPDGDYLSFADYDNGGFYLVDTISGEIRTIYTGYIFDEPSWAPDGQRLVYVADDDLLYIYNLQTDTSEPVSGLPADDYYYYPQWSPNNRQISYYRDNSGLAYILDLESGQEFEVVDADFVDYVQIEWNRDGYIGLQMQYNGNYAYYRVVPAGQFRFDNIALTIGENQIAASTAIPDVGTLLSDYIVVNYEAPDLFIDSDDVVIVPSVLKSNETARVNITVQNSSVFPVDNASLSLSVIDPAGNNQILFDRVPVENISNANPATRYVDWTPQAGAGTYTFVAGVDSENAITESDEDNNVAVKTFLVTDSNGIALTLSTDSEFYTPNQTVNIDSGVINSGDTFDGNLVVDITDTGGYLVDNVLNQAITGLEFNNSIETPVSWNTGDILAGSYWVTAKLYDITHELLAEQTVSITIGSVSSVNTRVESDKASYTANSPVIVTGTIQYLDGNTLLRGTTARLRILNGVGDIMEESVVNMPDLIAGTTETAMLYWNTGTYSPGQYQLEFVLEDNGQTLSSSMSNFEIVEEISQLAGEIFLSDNVPSAGDLIDAQFSISNYGNAAANQLPVIVSLRRDADATTLLSKSLVLDVGVSETVSEVVTLGTLPLAVQSYKVLLQIEEEDANGVIQLRTLATTGLSALDRIPPVITITSPAAESIVSNEVEVRYLINDNLSPIDSVSYQIDANEWIPAFSPNVASGEYINPLPYLLDGVHSIRIRATDSSGNTGYSDSVTFTVDGIHPVINITGVSDGDLVGSPVTAVIEVVDDYLSSTSIVLNGSSYQSGTLISEDGQYSLVVYAEDLAGNRSQSTVNFTIDTTAPVISISGVTDGQLSNTPVTPVITVFEPNLSSQTITLNGQEFVSGTTIVDDGTYLLEVSAADLPGNSAYLSVNFEIDTTVPELTIVSPQNGETVSESTVSIVGQTEALATVILSGSGGEISILADATGAFVFNDVALVEGENTFTFIAHDRAGNTSSELIYTLYKQPDYIIDLTGGLYSIPRLLIWMPGEHHGGHHRGNKALRTLLTDILNAGNIEYRIVVDKDEFTEQLYSQSYNILLVTDLAFDNGCNGKHDGDHKSALFREHCDHGNNCYQLDAHDRDWHAGRYGDKPYYDNSEQQECKNTKHSRSDDDYSCNEKGHERDGNITGRITQDLEYILKPSIASGMGLIVIKTHPDNSGIEDVLGAKVLGLIPEIGYIELEDSLLGSAKTIISNGKGVTLRTRGGVAIGYIAPANTPAVIINHYIEGKTVIAGFNPADFDDTSPASELLLKMVEFVKPQDNVIIPGGLTGVRWKAENLPQDINVELNQSLDESLKTVSVIDGEIIDIHHARWSRIAKNDQELFDSTISLPYQTGEYPVYAELYENSDGVLSSLVSAELSISIEQDILDLGDSLLERLSTVSPSSKSDSHKLFHARKLIKIAVEKEPDDIDSVTWTLSKLAEAYRKVESLNQPMPDVLRELSILIRAYEAEWYRLRESETESRHDARATKPEWNGTKHGNESYFLH